MSDTKVFQPGDSATFNGARVEIADIDWNYRPQCQCRDGCPRVQFDGGGYARRCELAEAPATAPADLHLAAQAGTHVVRLYTVGPDTQPLYRVEVTDGARVVDDLSRSYASEAAARAAARLITVTLRGIDRLGQLTAA